MSPLQNHYITADKAMYNGISYVVISRAQVNSPFLVPPVQTFVYIIIYIWNSVQQNHPCYTF